MIHTLASHVDRKEHLELIFKTSRHPCPFQEAFPQHSYLHPGASRFHHIIRVRAVHFHDLQRHEEPDRGPHGRLIGPDYGHLLRAVQHCGRGRVWGAVVCINRCTETLHVV